MRERVNWPVKRDPLVKRYPLLIVGLVVLSLVVYLSIFRGRHPASTHSVSSPGMVRTYRLRGNVVSTDATRGQVTLDHEAIAGFMSAMTMPYKLQDPTILGELHPGDTLTADVLVSDQDVLLDHIVIVGQAKPDYTPAALYHVPRVGEVVPDFQLLNQSNQQIHLAQYRGRAVLLTFIYTRCRLPDFCPRMSQNFAKIDQALAADQALYKKTHLVSISFDPDYDTPAVLRSYGAAYTGKYTNETFSHWDFAAPARGDLPEMAKFFDVGVAPETNQTITHSLSTVLIGPDSKVLAWYPGNDWKPDDLIEEIRQSFHTPILPYTDLKSRSKRGLALNQRKR